MSKKNATTYMEELLKKLKIVKLELFMKWIKTLRLINVTSYGWPT